MAKAKGKAKKAAPKGDKPLRRSAVKAAAPAATDLQNRKGPPKKKSPMPVAVGLKPGTYRSHGGSAVRGASASWGYPNYQGSP